MTNKEAISKIIDIVDKYELYSYQKDALNMAIEALKMQDKYSWIFYDSEPYNPLSKDLNIIEEALGIRLFTWQRTLIYEHGYRRSGRTTAESIKKLLPEDESPLILTAPVNPIHMFEQKEIMKIKQKLDIFGVKTREIIKKRY